ncbi:hypothetical protein [Methylobacter luteus]|uniref:hypothetical protein n=1 Tax=Methylobacter luteus TaxID=415 RepID=UPI00040A708F|nr:hypothetical protein [Methylobacter luteus]
MQEIRSEKEWLDFIHARLANPQDNIDIRFSGWPNLEVIIEGSRFNGTLPTELMRGFVEFQDEFYRAYAELRYKTKNIQRLTIDDRERLEFVFKIEDNCTKSSADETDLLNTIVENLGKIFVNMSGEEKLIGIALLVFALTGYKIFEKFSDNNLKAKEIEAGNESLRLQKQAVVEAIAASGRVPALATDFKHHAETAFRAIFKNAIGAESISIGDQSWDKKEIAEIIQKPDKSREKKELSLPLYIEGIRRNRGYLTLGVIDEDDRSFPMRVESNMADPDETTQLFDAFKNSRKIPITFTAKIIDGDIKAGSFIELAQK